MDIAWKKVFITAAILLVGQRIVLPVVMPIVAGFLPRRSGVLA